MLLAVSKNSLMRMANFQETNAPNVMDVLVSGHTGILATKDHIKQNKEFALDGMDNIKDAIDMVGSDQAVERCVETTTEQWTGKLNNLDELMTEHCQAMKDYVAAQ